MQDDDVRPGDPLGSPEVAPRPPAQVSGAVQKDRGAQGLGSPSERRALGL